jgi:hypothetical protein
MGPPIPTVPLYDLTQNGWAAPIWIAALTSTYYSQVLQISKALDDRDDDNKHRRIHAEQGETQKGVLEYYNQPLQI